MWWFLIAKLGGDVTLRVKETRRVSPQYVSIIFIPLVMIIYDLYIDLSPCSNISVLITVNCNESKQEV